MENLERVVAIFHTIEFQKTWPSPLHCLIVLHPDDKIHDANQVDNIVSAQLPDQTLNPLLYETITTCMLHGPCGADKPNALAWSTEGAATLSQGFNEPHNIRENGYPK